MHKYVNNIKGGLYIDLKFFLFVFVGASPAARQPHGEWTSGIAGVLSTGSGSPPQRAVDRRPSHLGY